MNKEDFNRLEIYEQVRVVNDLIISEGSIRQACKAIGIGKTTMRDRFKRNGYVYVSSLNLYDKVNNLELNNKKGKVIQDEKKDITLKSNIKLEKILPDILKLLELKNDLKNLVDKSNKEKSCTNILFNRLDLFTFNGDLKVKSIKIYEEVLERFNQFMKKNKQLKQQDVISEAMWEFLEKYDN